VAALDPLTAENRPQETIVVAAVAPGRNGTVLRAKVTNFWEIPPAVRRSPVATKSGTARKTYIKTASLETTPTFIRGKSTTQNDVAMTHPEITNKIGVPVRKKKIARPEIKYARSIISPLTANVFSCEGRMWVFSSKQSDENL
jgi:hypothetical protein